MIITKNLEDFRLEYGNHLIKVGVKANMYKDSLASNEIEYQSSPRVILSGQVVTLFNIPKSCSGIEVYVDGTLMGTVSYAGAVSTTGTCDIDLSDYELAAGTYDITLKVVCGDVKTETSSLSYTIGSLDSIFANNSWDDIINASNAGNIPSGWSIGDEKEVELSTGETITMQIIGFDHDDLADGSGKAHITLLMKNALATAYSMNSTNTNTGGWRDSAMRARMDTFYGYLPAELQAGIKTVNKKTALQYGDSTIITTEDKLFLLSHVEVMGTNKYSTSSQLSYSGEGSQYEYFKNAAIPTPKSGTGAFSVLEGTGCFYTTDTAVASAYDNRFGQEKSTSTNYYYNYNNAKAQGDSATTSCYWWLRSPYYYLRSYFCYVDSYGNSGNYYASSSYGVAFGFCI